METIAGPARGVYARYVVQEGDRLWNLWKKTEMTREEWVEVNGGRDPNKTIYPGDEIIIKDPIATCKSRSSYSLEQGTMREFSGDRHLDVCEDAVQYAVFKPLKAFTKVLKKE